MARARFWTCRKCKRQWPRTRQLCVCGTRRPVSRPPKHRAVLDVPYEQWVETFGERCGICGAVPVNKRLDRDHDHATGKPRGLLCHLCNRTLGNRVTPEWLDAAAAYLRREVDTSGIAGV